MSGLRNCPKKGKKGDCLEKHDTHRAGGKNLRCQGHSKRNRNSHDLLAQCNAIPIKGKQVCRNHGGESLEGAAHPQATTLMHSRKWPGRLARRAEALAEDPAALSLVPEMALIDDQIAGLLEDLEQGNLGEVWADVLDVAARVRVAQERKDVDGFQAGVRDMLALIEVGDHATAARKELRELIEQRRTLSDTETKRRKTAHDVISTDRMWGIVGNLIQMVSRRAREHFGSDAGPMMRSLIHDTRVLKPTTAEELTVE